MNQRAARRDPLEPASAARDERVVSLAFERRVQPRVEGARRHGSAYARHRARRASAVGNQSPGLVEPRAPNGLGAVARATRREARRARQESLVSPSRLEPIAPRPPRAVKFDPRHLPQNAGDHRAVLQRVRCVLAPARQRGRQPERAHAAHHAPRERRAPREVLRPEPPPAKGACEGFVERRRQDGVRERALARRAGRAVRPRAERARGGPVRDAPNQRARAPGLCFRARGGVAPPLKRRSRLGAAPALDDGGHLRAAPLEVARVLAPGAERLVRRQARDAHGEEHGVVARGEHVHHGGGPLGERGVQVAPAPLLDHRRRFPPRLRAPRADKPPPLERHRLGDAVPARRDPPGQRRDAFRARRARAGGGAPQAEGRPQRAPVEPAAQHGEHVSVPSLRPRRARPGDKRRVLLAVQDAEHQLRQTLAAASFPGSHREPRVERVRGRRARPPLVRLAQNTAQAPPLARPLAPARHGARRGKKPHLPRRASLQRRDEPLVPLRVRVRERRALPGAERAARRAAVGDVDGPRDGASSDAASAGAVAPRLRRLGQPRVGQPPRGAAHGDPSASFLERLHAPLGERVAGPPPEKRGAHHPRHLLSLRRRRVARVAHLGAVKRGVPDPLLPRRAHLPPEPLEHRAHLLPQLEHLTLHLFARANLLQDERAPLLDQHAGHRTKRVRLFLARGGKSSGGRRETGGRRDVRRAMDLGLGRRSGGAPDLVLVERHFARHGSRLRPTVRGRWVVQLVPLVRPQTAVGVARQRVAAFSSPSRRRRFLGTVAFASLRRPRRRQSLRAARRAGEHLRRHARDGDPQHARRQTAVAQAERRGRPARLVRFIERLPLLVHAVVPVEEAQPAPASVPRLQQLPVALRVRAEAQELALAHHHQVRRGVRHGCRILQRAQREPDSLAGRRAVSDVRQAVREERDRLAGAERAGGERRVRGAGPDRVGVRVGRAGTGILFPLVILSIAAGLDLGARLGSARSSDAEQSGRGLLRPPLVAHRAPTERRAAHRAPECWPLCRRRAASSFKRPSCPAKSTTLAIWRRSTSTM